MLHELSRYMPKLAVEASSQRRLIVCAAWDDAFEMN
jgi:hypothetical protein